MNYINSGGFFGKKTVYNFILSPLHLCIKRAKYDCSENKVC